MNSARRWIIGLCGLALALAVAVAALPPLPEPPMFRGLADDRAFFGIASFLNVISNAPFLLIGGWGLYFLARAGTRQPGAFTDPLEKWPYACCFLAIALVSAGSAYYHLRPDGARLMWDRLPMGLGFMSLLAAVVVERVSAKAGLRLLLPLLLAGAGSVIYWRWSVLRGTENIFPYAAVQYGSIAAVLAIAVLFPSRYTRGNDIFGVVAIYAAAKAAEVLDAEIYALGHVVSGHTLKHLLAALAAWWLLRMLQLRRPQYSPV